jgi:hypothetical protein
MLLASQLLSSARDAACCTCVLPTGGAASIPLTQYLPGGGARQKETQTYDQRQEQKETEGVKSGSVDTGRRYTVVGTDARAHDEVRDAPERWLPRRSGGEVLEDVEADEHAEAHAKARLESADHRLQRRRRRVVRGALARAKQVRLVPSASDKTT